jgi:hypothetical protein
MYAPVDKLPKIKWTSKRLWFMSQVHPSTSGIKTKDYWTFADDTDNADSTASNIRPLLIAQKNFCYNCCGIKIAVMLYNSCFRSCVKSCHGFDFADNWFWFPAPGGPQLQKS